MASEKPRRQGVSRIECAVTLDAAVVASKVKTKKCPLDFAIRRSSRTSESNFSGAVEAGVSLRNLNEKSSREVRQCPEGDVELRKHFLRRKKGRGQ